MHSVRCEYHHLVSYIRLVYNKQTLALRQASEVSACFLLSFFCDDENLQAYLFSIVKGHKDGGK